MNKGVSKATVLLECSETKIPHTLFHDQSGTTWVSMKIQGVVENIQIKGPQFVQPKSSIAGNNGGRGLAEEKVDSVVADTRTPALDDMLQVDSDPEWRRMRVGNLADSHLQELALWLHRAVIEFYADKGLPWS